MVGMSVTLKGHMHVCPMVDPGPPPHVGGPVVQLSQNFVCAEGMPIATVGDRCLCTGVPTTSDAITGGSSIAFISGRKIARQTYAIVDASRQPMVIPAALGAFASRVRCLFSDSALREFGDNAAWVFETDPTEGTLRWLLEQGFKKRWAIFVNSSPEIGSFVRHLKKFAVANGDGGRTFFFRFYDPHVVRQYLPVFDERQMRLFFREIDDVVFEDTSGRHTLLKYDLADDGRLNRTPLV